MTVSIEEEFAGKGRFSDKNQGNFGGMSLSGDRSLLALFTATIFLSAFLLFSVQPMFAKLVLPKLGGSPGVWSVAMVFFQSMLLLGYGYAHLLTSKLSLKVASIVHLGVLAIAFIALPLAIPDGWGAPPESGQTFWLLGLFAAGVGLPFFAVSANGPLLQAWFSRTGHPHAADPYFLYGASNIGSFASLILYIVFFEPQFALSTQGVLWSAGFFTLAALIGACAIYTISRLKAETARAADSAETIAASEATLSDEVPSWKMRALWVALSFVPSGLLVAMTAYISTDVAAAPFLWVIPLALFLLTFVLAFQRKQWLPEGVLSPMVPIAAAAVIAALYLRSFLPVYVIIGIHTLFFFIAALYCHTRLVDNRPSAKHLTEFYLLMSVGGVLGGIFASLVAMQLFTSIFEYPILIVGALLARKRLYEGELDKTAVLGGLGLMLGIAAYVAGTFGFVPAFADGGVVLFVILVLAAVSALAFWFSEAVAAQCMMLFLPLALLHSHLSQDLYAERTFFGVVSARSSTTGTHHLMYHGTTLHGAQQYYDDSGSKLAFSPDNLPEALTYYHQTGAIRTTLAAAQERFADKTRNIGVVGLGTGSLLCHRKGNENWKMYEIDRSVVTMASNPDLFNYVSDCGADTPMIVGDARITLGDEANGAFDYLLIDAFSSDAIPVHLMTQEAFRLYVSKLSEQGILAIHISNRYMDLRGVIAAIAREEGLAIKTGIFEKVGDPAQTFITRNRVVVLARDEAHFGPVINDDPRWTVPSGKDADVWTDDYSNILKLLVQNMRSGATEK